MVNPKIVNVDVYLHVNSTSKLHRISAKTSYYKMIR